MNLKGIKSKFPIFHNNPGLVFLDNASTTQKPQRVIDSIVNYYSKYNANVHRGLYPLSQKATDQYEEARIRVAKFINADPEEIIFTSGTTESLNFIATVMKESGLVGEESEVLLSEAEHHSNFLPFKQNFKTIKFLSLDKNYDLEFSNMGTPDIVTVYAASNTLGTITDLKKLKALAKDSFIVVDAAQIIGHRKVDVKDLDIDFMAFSGHKLYGPTGIGVLYVKKEILNKLNPYKFGGGMIREVKKSDVTFAAGPEKYEAGTPNIEGAIGLGAAIDFINHIGFEEIQKHETNLRKYLIEKLRNLEDIQIYHPSLETDALGVVSFNIKRIHPHDIADYLGQHNICVRAGHHCAQILHRDLLNVSASLRVSLGIYNTEEDIDLMISKLTEASQVYKK